MLGAKRVRFGEFEFDLSAAELRKGQTWLRLQEQPAKILTALLEHPGEVVSREDLIALLWPDNTHVGFDHGLNAAVNRLRQVLLDSAESPRYVETVARRGYRLIVAVEPVPETTPLVQPEVENPPVPRPRFRFAAVALGIFVVFLLAGWLLLPNPPNAPGEFQRPEPLTSFPGREIFPSFSPEGDRVAFMWEGENRDNWDVYVKLIGQDGLQRLTTHPAADWSPAWSPDGKQIAFVRRHADDRVEELIVIPAIGGPERTLLKGSRIDTISAWNQVVRLVAWHPDSEHLIVSNAEEAGQPHLLYAVSSKTGEKKQLTYADGELDGDFDPAVSPDGRRLAFRRKLVGWNSNVYVVDLSPEIHPDGKPVVVAHRMSSPAWSADSQDLFIVESATRPALWRVNPKEGRLRRVREPIEAAFPAIAATGKRSAFSVISVHVDVWKAALTGDPSPKPVIASTYPDLVPKFSPDGKKIAFASSRSGNLEIWVSDRNGRNAVQLTDHGSVDADCPAWSPDGTRIAYHANEGDFRDVFVINAAGGVPQRLTTQEGLDFAPTWSRDGNWIYFASAKAGERCVWKVPSQGGESVRVARGTYAQESVDGKALFVDEGQALWRMPAVGGTRTRLLDRTWLNANFEVRETGIYFLYKQSLNFYDFESGSVQKVFTTANQVSWGLSISPDDQTVLFTQSLPDEANVMIVGEFR